MRNFFLSLRAGRAHWKRITWNLNSIINQTTTPGCFAVDPVPGAQNALHSTAIRSHRFGQTMIYVSQPLTIPSPSLLLANSERVARLACVWKWQIARRPLIARNLSPPPPSPFWLSGKWKKVAAVICSACFPHTHAHTRICKCHSLAAHKYKAREWL